ncbi:MULTISPECIES: molybdate ABC transporter substrate-binding protein [Hydrogenophaga]|nr:MULTISPECIES: substrate-binding domain-containing protein [Hydrogenophaga]
MTFSFDDRFHANPVPHAAAPAMERRQWLTAGLAWAALSTVPLRVGAQSDSATLLLMAGAGYRRPLEALCQAFTQETGIAVERSYGNLQQVFAQARASGRVDVLVGDADFIRKAEGLNLSQRLPLGQGVMALAWRRDLPGQPEPSGSAGARAWLEVAGLSVAMPHPQQAIYGLAAQQWLQAQGLWEGLQPRLKIVGTVPQVSAYLTSGQVDLGFVNLTEALGAQAQLGGFLPLPAGEGSYRPIEIVAAMPAPGAHPQTQAARERWTRFLSAPKAQELLRRAGL